MSELREQLVTTIARQLGETDPLAIEQIRRLIERAGPMRVVALVKDAQALDRGAGLLTLDGSRRRTLAGCFFYLARRYLGLSCRAKRYCFPFRPQKGTAPAGFPAAGAVADSFGEAQPTNTTGNGHAPSVAQVALQIKPISTGFDIVKERKHETPLPG